MGVLQSLTRAWLIISNLLTLNAKQERIDRGSSILCINLVYVVVRIQKVAGSARLALEIALLRTPLYFRVFGACKIVGRKSVPRSTLTAPLGAHIVNTVGNQT